MSVQSEVDQRVGVPDLLGVAEAAALLRVGLTFAYASTAQFIATGSDKEILAIKVGRLTRVPRAAFERFCRRSRSTSSTGASTATVTTRLLDAGHLDPRGRIDVGGLVLYPGQPVVTRANDRTLTYGLDVGEWVRNGDRWTVDAGTRDELYLTNADNGHRIAIPADYVADGNLAVDYASTINRAHGATVDEAHVIINDRTNAKQLYVAMSAMARRRQLRELTLETHTDQLAPPSASASASASAELALDDEASERVAAAMRRLQSLTRRPSQGLER